jgi:dihydroxyacetone kinase-like predicted kinase
MAYSGRYIPSNRIKYKGNPLKIIYRSLWERRLMQYSDKTSKVIEWGSEEIAIPYVSPLDNHIHRYFPDFYMKVKQKNGSLKKFIIEVKPKRYLKPPPQKPKKRTRKWLNEVRTYAVNKAKFKSAAEYCKDKGFEFKILTEDHLAPQYK